MKNSYISSLFISFIFISGILSAQNAPDTTWTQMYSGGLYDWAWQVQQTTDGGYILAGDTYIYEQGEYNYYLVKINPEQGVGIHKEIQTKYAAYCYPNPTTGMITIQGKDIESVEITNINGQLIKQLSVNTEQASIEIDLSRYGKGVYFINTRTDNQIFTNMVIVK